MKGGQLWNRQRPARAAHRRLRQPCSPQIHSSRAWEEKGDTPSTRCVGSPGWPHRPRRTTIGGARVKVIVDTLVCNGHGDCVAAAPTVFDLPGDADVVRVLDEDPDETYRAQVNLAAAMCPVAAITITG